MGVVTTTYSEELRTTNVKLNNLVQILVWMTKYLVEKKLFSLIETSQFE